ncbi:hypothetical protein [Shouchella lonarensis]|uniref:Uncharacterized protein n=1 Tax=Shouchella lonarensis TaxID=1464122 RepID=A0A1G6HJA1_9BACI|nr:hypothetical protein [Shouchella lonarensis]SDB94322.1 hypothetical protein SAMN05421737_10413 [Shouchella lonarensis]
MRKTRLKMKQLQLKKKIRQHSAIEEDMRQEIASAKEGAKKTSIKVGKRDNMN